MRELKSATDARRWRFHPFYLYFISMKLQGIAGKGSGKLGSQVYAISGGQQIVRQYNGAVTNPSTEGQVETRSKFKLLSQLAAAMGNVIAIKRVGLVSGRNQFMQVNKAAAQYVGSDATINLNKVQITKSARGLENFEADRSVHTSILVQFQWPVTSVADRVVYACFKKQADGSLVLFDSKVVSDAGADGNFPGNLAYTNDAVVIYAYGIKVTNAAANTAFGNMVAPSAEQVAKLITTTSEVAAGTQVTKTKALTMAEGVEEGSSEGDDNFLVSVSASGIGSATGGGRFDAGQPCTVVATPAGGSTFTGWHIGSASGPLASTQQSYTFAVESDIALVAVFEGGSVPSYTINASVSPNGYGTVSGAGSKQMGTTCTLVATPAQDKVFKRWTENGSTVSTSATYSFTVDRARTLVAVFDDASTSPFSGVKIGTDDWDSNQSGTVGAQIPNITGSVVSAGANMVGLFKSENEPAIGRDAGTAYGTSNNLSNFNITPDYQDMTAGKYWLCAVDFVSDLGEYDVLAVFEYNLTLQ